MIQLTKLNQQQITINAIFIERVEATPDTVISFINGKKLIVAETVEEVCTKVTAYYKKINLLYPLQEIKEEQIDGEE